MELSIGSGHEQPCSLCDPTRSSDAQPLPIEEIEQRIRKIAPDAALLCGYEPFMHPELVRIVSSMVSAGIRRIGMRTDGGALSNPQAAHGCIEAGVRVFEIPLLAGDREKADRLSATPGLHAASAHGIAQINAASTDLDVAVFVCALIPLCSHNASQLVEMTQAALSAGVCAIRVECTDKDLIDHSLIITAHALATRAGVALFGAGCDSFIEGATLYEVRP
ncbi:MAG: hypothetical protein FWE87_06050 [Coriobacteriia bacterium]|nr:hypothetical protein [Coriobacteriia bacterium]